jgi:hypothetical protein
MEKQSTAASAFRRHKEVRPSLKILALSQVILPNQHEETPCWRFSFKVASVCSVTYSHPGPAKLARGDSPQNLIQSTSRTLAAGGDSFAPAHGVPHIRAENSCRGGFIALGLAAVRTINGPT